MAGIDGVNSGEDSALSTHGRNNEIRRRYKNGELQADLAAAYGLSQGRIHQIVKNVNKQCLELPISERPWTLSVAHSDDDCVVIRCDNAWLAPIMFTVRKGE